jgi:hypothetical protein
LCPGGKRLKPYQGESEGRRICGPTERNFNRRKNFERKPNVSRKNNGRNQMKKYTKISLAVTLALAVIIVTVKTLAQTAPTLSIAPVGTNTFNITVGNSVGGTSYALYWTPILDSVDYPWTAAAIGTNGQTNFYFNGEGYSMGFFMAVVSTNSIPPWELADPNNPSLGILAVYIDSPTNGAVIQ